MGSGRPIVRYRVEGSEFRHTGETSGSTQVKEAAHTVFTEAKQNKEQHLTHSV